MSKRLLTILYILLAAVTLSFFVMTVLASAGNDGILHSVYTTATLVGLAVLLIAAIIAYNPRATVYSIGFYLAHAGILFFLIGCLFYAVFGHSVLVSPPNAASLTPSIQAKMYESGVEIPNGYYNRIPGKDGAVAELGFNFRISDFETEYYDDGVNVKHYEASLDILDGENEIIKTLTVNHPIYHRGWKVYLMSVSSNPAYGYEEVQLLFKRDPGEMFSTSGIILTIVGVFAMSFLRPRAKKEDEE